MGVAGRVVVVVGGILHMLLLLHSHDCGPKILTSSLNGWTSCASAFLIITCFVVLLQLITVCTVHDVCVDSQHT